MYAIRSYYEYEYTIPVEEAKAMLDDLCPQPQIEKIRYTIPFAGFLWEVDEFLGVNQGLVVAEIELEYEEQSVITSYSIHYTKLYEGLE